jgi:hypothetical protein
MCSCMSQFALCFPNDSGRGQESELALPKSEDKSTTSEETAYDTDRTIR